MTDNLLNDLKQAQAKIELENLSKNRDVKKYRKDRAHRLITKGALLEKYFECDNLTIEETEELLKIFANYVNANKPNQFKKGV
ncbi:hypothetical protein CW670_10905 [Macrococcoides caseolyticum]|uniref:DUF3847 domain-containing protein n=1 Tax=Macrococcoides caseolyticum TaxID=69966 RepID=UPI000C32E13E|nr:DUF3847 domain-containing protein [Macrococcus caseolyticus]PKE73640.1 hypothetical protein CW670_10905 [Macrococcus caseolyticus]